MKKLIVWSWVVLIVFPLYSFGAEGNHKGASEMVRVRFLSLLKLPEEKYKVECGKIRQMIKITNWQLSGPLKLPPGVDCKIIRPVQDGDEEGKDEVVAEFKLGSVKSGQLVVLVPSKLNPCEQPIDGKPDKSDTGDEKPEIAYQVRVLRIGVNQLLKGESYAVNFSDKALEIDYGGEKTEVEPGQTLKIATPDRKEGDFVAVKGQFRLDDKWKRFLSSRWVLSTSVRRLVFIYPDRPPRKGQAGQSSTIGFHGLEVPAVGGKGKER